MSTRVIILISSMAGGKDTLMNKIVNHMDVHKMISVTTRPMRANEKEGYDYFFTDTLTFANMDLDNKFIEVREYLTAHGKWYYGLPKSEIIEGKNNIVIVDAHGSEEVDRYCRMKNYECIKIYLKCPFETRIKRYMDRDKMTDSECIELCRRLIDDYNQVEPYADKCDYVWDNETPSDMLLNTYRLGGLISGDM